MEVVLSSSNRGEWQALGNGVEVTTLSTDDARLIRMRHHGHEWDQWWTDDPIRVELNRWRSIGHGVEVMARSSDTPGTLHVRAKESL